MNYSIKAKTVQKEKGSIKIRSTEISFGIISDPIDSLPNPAELFLGSIAACLLKNVERFSEFMKFEYHRAEVKIDAIRNEQPLRMEEIQYRLNIYSSDRINLELLKRNIEKFGTIFSTVKSSCNIIGVIQQTNV